MQYIYRRNGTPFGFIRNGYFFASDCTYLGWVNGDEIWKEDGNWLGYIVDDIYVMRRYAEPLRPLQPLKPLPPLPPLPPLQRLLPIQPLRAGWEDALEDYPED